jgi:hypothetical protein
MPKSTKTTKTTIQHQLNDLQKQTQAQNAANDSIFYTSTHPFFPSITNQLQTALFLTGMAPTSNQVDT